MLVAAFTTATFAMGTTTAIADHYPRSCGGGYPGYSPAYFPPPVYAPAPVYAYAPYRTVTYVQQPVYYPRYYAPAPVYRSYYSPSSFSFGFGYSKGGYGGYGGYGVYRGHGGHGGYGGYYGHGGNRGHASHYGGGVSFRVGG